MAQATFSVRMDDSLKNQFEVLCNDLISKVRKGEVDVLCRTMQ